MKTFHCSRTALDELKSVLEERCHAYKEHFGAVWVGKPYHCYLWEVRLSDSALHCSFFDDKKQSKSITIPNGDAFEAEVVHPAKVLQSTTFVDKSSSDSYRKK